MYSSLRLLCSLFPTVLFLWFSPPFLCFLSLCDVLTEVIERPCNQCFELHLVDCLSPSCFVLFLELFSVLSFGTCFWVSSFILPPCVSFRVFGRAVMSPSLGGVGFRSRCPLGSGGTACLVT